MYNIDGLLNSINYIFVTSASAKMAGELFSDLVARVGLAGVQHGHGTHDDAGDAKAALHRELVDEGLLDGVERAIGSLQALRGENGLALRPLRQVQAAVRRDAVDEHRAGPALSDLAATLHAREVEPVAQGVKKGLAGVKSHLHLRTVDGALENSHVH